MRNHLKLGDWNVACDVCGLKYKASQIKKRWDGLMVCSKDYEQRHPSDFLRIKTEKISVPFVRPDSTILLHDACSIEGLTALPGYMMPGCSIPSRISPLS